MKPLLILLLAIVAVLALAENAYAIRLYGYGYVRPPSLFMNMMMIWLLSLATSMGVYWVFERCYPEAAQRSQGTFLWATAWSAAAVLACLTATPNDGFLALNGSVLLAILAVSWKLSSLILRKTRVRIVIGLLIATLLAGVDFILMYVIDARTDNFYFVLTIADLYIMAFACVLLLMIVLRAIIQRFIPSFQLSLGRRKVFILLAMLAAAPLIFLYFGFHGSRRDIINGLLSLGWFVGFVGLNTGGVYVLCRLVLFFFKKSPEAEVIQGAGMLALLLVVINLVAVFVLRSDRARVAWDFIFLLSYFWLPYLAYRLVMLLQPVGRKRFFVGAFASLLIAIFTFGSYYMERLVSYHLYMDAVRGPY